jgi:PAS domain S-box-containing protein
VEEALTTVLRRVCTETGWALGLGWMPGPDGRLRCRALFHDSVPELLEFAEESWSLGFQPGEGLPGRVWADRSPLWLEDMSEAPHFPRAPMAHLVGLVAAAVVPIMAGEEPVAVLEFFVSERREQDEGFVRMLATVGVGLGSFIRQKQAEERLRESEERFRMLADSANDAIVSADSEGVLTYLNPGAERLFGLPSAEAVGKPITLLMPERYQEAHRAGFQRYLETGVPKIIGTTVDLFARRADGTEVSVEVSLASAETGRGPIFTAIVRDITQRKEAEDTLTRALSMEREAAQVLRESAEMKNTFLHAVSHDLRNPLTAILGLISMLESDENGRLTLSSDERRSALRRLRVNSDRMNRLVTELLDLDRLQAGRITPQLERADLGELARRVVEGADLPHDRPVELDTESAYALIDQGMIERVIDNLLFNALRHTPHGTSIWVRVRMEAEGVLVAVDDAGPGVPEDMRELIFRPFVQGERIGSPGMGIGLSLVARFVELHGGRAWVEERPGGGSSFRVLIPAEG